MNFISQLRFAIRSLRKSPGLSITVVLLLAFGIGANVSLFHLIYSVLLRPIPGIQRSGDLIRIRRTDHGRVQGNQSYPDYLDLGAHTMTLERIVAERLIPVRISGPPAQILPGAIVTSNYFETLGVRAFSGRLFDRNDDGPVVVISEAFWQRQFGRSAQTVGSTLVLNGYPFTVVGVVGAPFEGVEFGQPTEVWMPMMMVRQAMTRSPDYHWLTDRRAGWLTVYGLAKPGVPIKTVAAELNTIAQQLAQQYPESNEGRGIEVSTNPNMSPEQRDNLRSLLGLLAVAVCLVLLIACGNAANIMLARTTARGRELAIRLAVGANRWLLMKQLLVESLLLGLGGGLLGLILVPWILPVLQAAGDSRQFRDTKNVFDLPLLGFTLGISVITVLLVGLIPAWGAHKLDVAATLKASSPQGGNRGWRTQRIWVIAQVTLSVALVASGASVLRSMQRILAIDPGYQPDKVLMATMDLSLLGYSEERGSQVFLDLLSRVSSLPGVAAATLGKSSPAVDWSDRLAVFRQGEASPPNSRYDQAPGALMADCNIIAPGYFRTLGIPLIAGRDFSGGDRRGAPAVVIVSASLAGKLWPGQSAVGRQMIVPLGGTFREPTQVIGVAADSRYRSLIADSRALVYIALTQHYDSIARLMVAVEGDPRPFKRTLMHALEEAAPELPIRSINTMQEQIEQSLWDRRAATALLGLFGALALILSCAGIYAVVSYGVAQQTRQIGIRMALGADRGYVVRQVLGRTLKLTAIGVCLGIPLALCANPLLTGFLYKTRIAEPSIMIGVPLLFLLIGLGAGFLPARRAATTDPMMVLRQE